MEQLQQAVTDSFKKIVESGVIETAIEKKLTETINSILDTELRSYSDFGKQLGAQVKSALNVDFSNLELPGYNDLILKIVRRQVDGHVAQSVAAHVEEQMAALLAPPPAEIKLSKLVADFIESKKSDDCSCSGSERISLHIEEINYGGYWIFMDPAEGKEKYRCGVRIGVSSDDNRVFSLNIDEKNAKSTLFVGPMYNFERDLFQMYAMGTKLIVDKDADDIDTRYPGHDD
jgi:hypothetical protein